MGSGREVNEIRVMVVDDHVMVRRGIETLLTTQPDLALAGEAGDGEAAVLLHAHLKPEVTLMDMVMPRLDGVEAIRRIRAASPDARIIALTSFDSDDLVNRALDAGAIGYLLKNATAEELAHAIRNAHAGRRTLAPEAADALLRKLQKPPEVGHDLTVREREVLGHMATGLNNTEIAQLLHLSASTVKFHVSAILSKLGVTNRVEAVALALQHGLIQR
jgi:NarL family two-component system response regulator LiaR